MNTWFAWPLPTRWPAPSATPRPCAAVRRVAPGTLRLFASATALPLARPGYPDPLRDRRLPRTPSLGRYWLARLGDAHACRGLRGRTAGLILRIPPRRRLPPASHRCRGWPPSPTACASSGRPPGPRNAARPPTSSSAASRRSVPPSSGSWPPLRGRNHRRPVAGCSSRRRGLALTRSPTISNSRPNSPPSNGLAAHGLTGFPTETLRQFAYACATTRRPEAARLDDILDLYEPLRFRADPGPPRRSGVRRQMADSCGSRRLRPGGHATVHRACTTGPARCGWYGGTAGCTFQHALTGKENKKAGAAPFTLIELLVRRHRDPGGAPAAGPGQPATAPASPCAQQHAPVQWSRCTSYAGDYGIRLELAAGDADDHLDPSCGLRTTGCSATLSA